MTVLSFAKEVHHNFQDLDSNHLESLSKAVDAIADEHKTPDDQKNDIQRNWNRYDNAYNKVWVRFLSNTETRREKVKVAYIYLDGIADNKTKPFLNECKNHIEQIDEDIPAFQALQTELRKNIASANGLHNILENYNVRRDFWGNLSSMTRKEKFSNKCRYAYYENDRTDQIG